MPEEKATTITCNNGQITITKFTRPYTELQEGYIIYLMTPEATEMIWLSKQELLDIQVAIGGLID